MSVLSSTSPTALAMAKKDFAESGYVVVRGMWSDQVWADLRSQIELALDPVVGPAEFEADVGYPGAPQDRTAPGGGTPRRLLNAYARHAVFRQLAVGVEVEQQLTQLVPPALAGDRWLMSQCHHNCVMTKYPGYSSATLWHQDIRYWSFDRPDLVSMWVALGQETASNGALRVIPGSHRLDLELDRGRFDRDLFLRTELPENRELIRQSVVVELEVGDALLFHCRLLHAAGRNQSAQPKLSCVFTYHEQSNRPIPGTRSAAFASVPVGGS